MLKARGFHLGDGRLGAAALGWGALMGATSGAGVLLLAMLMAAGLVYSRVSPTPYVGRIADIVDVIAIMALLPLAAGVIGIK